MYKRQLHAQIRVERRRGARSSAATTTMRRLLAILFWGLRCAAEECSDRNLECAEWAAEGQCRDLTDHGKFVREVACRHSCGRCRTSKGAPAPTARAPPPARARPRAPTVARRSAAADDAAQAIEVDASGGIQRHATRSAQCLDENLSCSAWAAYGGCDGDNGKDPAWMRAHCALSCGVCGDGAG